MKTNKLLTSTIVALVSLMALVGWAQPDKVLQIFRNGNIIQEYDVSDIDYIEVNDRVDAPVNVNASLSNGTVVISWDAIPDAEYAVYRSSDNVNFTLLAKNLKTNSFTDAAPLNGTNYYRVKAAVNGVEGGFSSSVSVTAVINGHEYVDLGLLSGLKWATCNMGATSPSDYGNYYAWGETATKPSYTEGNSLTYDITLDDISGNSQYDAARATWGGTWRLPTKSECEELIKNCTWTFIAEGNQIGYRVTGPNGNSIFLPTAGYRYEALLNNVGLYGEYWSSTPYDAQSAYVLGFNRSYKGVFWYPRRGGRTVRPVSE